MFLFSTGTRYPHEETLTPFSIYAIQNHNGDIKSAMSDLYKQGYGARFAKPAKKKVIKSDSELLVENVNFPIDVFPENIQAYILDVHKTLNASIDYLAFRLLEFHYWSDPAEARPLHKVLQTRKN